MKFDYGRLLGKLKECGITQAELAQTIGNTASTLSLKLNNKAYFKQTEITSVCQTLGITPEEIGLYFFAARV